MVLALNQEPVLGLAAPVMVQVKSDGQQGPPLVVLLKYQLVLPVMAQARL